MPCVWVACLNPPVPPTETHLSTNTSAFAEIPISNIIYYFCDAGHYFDTSLNKTHIAVNCLANNVWNVPPSWEHCFNVTGKSNTYA